VNSLEEVLGVALAVQDICQRQQWRFCFIGGVAVQRWSNPRFTDDVDLTLLTGFGGEEKFVNVLLRAFKARRPDAREFALRSRVLLLEAGANIGIDVALGALPFEERTIARSSAWEYGGGSLITCSSEDLLIHKVFAGRDRDWGDVENILIRRHGKLDLNLIRSELKPLLAMKEEPDALPKFEKLVITIAQRLNQPP
jgi:hypothetical protein